MIINYADQNRHLAGQVFHQEMRINDLEAENEALRERIAGGEWWVEADVEEWFGDGVQWLYAGDGNEPDWDAVLGREPDDADRPVVLTARRMVAVERAERRWPDMAPCERCGGDGCDSDDLGGCGLSGGNGWRHPAPVLLAKIRRNIRMAKSNLEVQMRRTEPTSWGAEKDAEWQARTEARLAHLMAVEALLAAEVEAT